MAADWHNGTVVTDISPEMAAPASMPAGSATARDLLLADSAIVQAQNLQWLARRFGFQRQLSQLDLAADLAPLETPYMDLPTWKRWITLLRLATVGSDEEARQRIKTAISFRLLGRQPGTAALAPIMALDSDVVDEDTYAAWIGRYDALTASDRTIIQSAIASADLPALQVVISYDPARSAALASLLGQLQQQLYPAASALLVLDNPLASADASLLAADPRIATVARHELPARLTAPYALVLDLSVTLRPETLFTFADAARSHPSWQLIYADEDRLDGTERHRPIFKPVFAPELNRRMAYLGACVCVRTAAITEPPAGAVAEWAAALASRLDPARVGRVPRILFHRDDAAAEAPPRPAPAPQWPEPSVAIIIPTRNLAQLLATCVDSIRNLTDYPPEKLHFVIIDNGSDQPDALALLDRLGREPQITILRDPSAFNYARLNNAAAAAARQEVLVFLNNDTEIVEPGWLRAMAGWAATPGIGVVGPKLLYPDRTIQHAGVVLGIGGVAGHSFVGLPADSPGYLGLASVTREAAALTGACIAIRRALFEAIGGFDPHLEIAFNDTALCCESIRRGNRNLYLGDVAVVHHESKSRGFDDTPEKLARFHSECSHVRLEYKSLFDQDPYYSPNLGLERQYQPAIPRAPRPWHGHRRRIDPNPRVLILSDVHAVGHGVPVVIQQHAQYLGAQGWTVFVGGPLRDNEITYRFCQRVYLDNPAEAQSFAYRADVDCVIVHTIPYFTMFRNMSAAPRRVIFDHGEPPAAWFPDQRAREIVNGEKQFSYRLADLVLTNTSTVRDEIAYDRAEVAGLGNSHLATWDDAQALRRAAIRARLGLEGKIVVLNVCRFHKAERRYKGIADYVALRRDLVAAHPEYADRLVFVLCGKGKPEDRDEMLAAGLTVFTNVTDAELIDLYVAADLYANFSKWEGFNLGIAQALAMGLEVVASDIPAHRQFPIATADDPAERVRLLGDALDRHKAGHIRRAVLLPWQPLLEWLAWRLRTLCAPADADPAP
ncbi:MAG: glycosyltransferase [Acetobacteraceae bacterium]|nr:glycosyltransferase [Acetobacteraceae bacterium]